MPLVVPALRFFVLFLNVYETFKTLKPPPPSARRGGRPSVRAITQRKRDLKGCLAVWVVWCCYTVYERTFDRLVGIFLPFYSEIKSVFLLFLVLTRSKGAEPLFLHVLRPFVKPYTAVVDPVLEISRDIGDFFFALVQVPLDYIFLSPWLSLLRNGELEEEPGRLSPDARISSADSTSSIHTGNYPDIQISAECSIAMQAPRAQNKHHRSARGISDNLRSNDGIYQNSFDPRTLRDRHLRPTSTASLPAYSEHPTYDTAQYAQSLPRRNAYQIWYPPGSASPLSNQPVTNTTLDPSPTAPEYHSPEWRTYPAFPSAYPPTPLPASASLPTSVTIRSDSDDCIISHPAFPPIPEDEQVFDKPLEGHEEHPGFVQNSSNSRRVSPGVSGYKPDYDTTQHEDDDTLLDDSMCSSEAGLSEDDFGASLRTPHHFPKAIPSGAYSSADSLANALTTADNPAALRTTTSSESLSSGSSSLAGQKRTHGVFQGKARNMIAVSQSRNGTLRGRVPPPVIPQDLLQSSPSEGEDESGLIDDGSAKAKRQKVLDPLKRKSTVRPTLRGTGGAHKVLPSRSTAARGRHLTTTSQTTLRSRAGTVTPSNLTIKNRKTTLVPRQVARGGPQGIVQSSSTSSSRSGTSSGRVY